MADPALYDKIHVVRIIKSRRAGAKLITEQDGARVLVLGFAFRSVRRSRNPFEGSTKVIDLPSASKVLALVSKLGPRPDVARFRHDRRFQEFLAELGCVLVVRGTTARDDDGYRFHQVLHSYGRELADGVVLENLKARLLRHQESGVFVLRASSSREHGLEEYSRGVHYQGWGWLPKDQTTYRPFVEFHPSHGAVPSLEKLDASLSPDRESRDCVYSLERRESEADGD